jgi:hypothetical protein
VAGSGDFIIKWCWLNRPIFGEQFMPTVVADPGLTAKLATLTEPAEIVDERGGKLGRYLPEPFCPWDPTLTPEEADQIANESEDYALDEILRELGGK